jgi:hypothetical protein
VSRLTSPPLASVPGLSRSARNSLQSCPGRRGDEAPSSHAPPGGASPQAGTAAKWVPNGPLLPFAALPAVPAALSGSLRRAHAKVCSLLLLASFAALPCQAGAQPAAAPTPSVQERARAAAAAARARSGDSDTLQLNYITPGLGGQPISTVDGSQTFAANLACQKSANLLELVAQPGPSGDIATLRIARDTDLSGAYDQIFNVGAPISGICANGVISCDPGTWSQCRPFAWSAESGQLSLRQVELTQLAGCYCVNNSCGTNLVWGNMASVLKDLGGGVVAALTSADPRIGVAQASIDGPVIRYSGAQTAACTSNPTLAASTYRTNPTAISGDAHAASRASSVFQALTGSPAGLGAAREKRACTIRREVSVKDVTIEDVIARTSGGYATNADASGRVDFFLGSPAKHSLRSGGCRLFDYRMTLTVGDESRIRAATLPFIAVDDWAQVRIDGQLVTSGPGGWTGTGLPPGDCEMDGTTTYAPNIDLKPYLTTGTHEVWLRIAVADKGNGFAQIQALVDTSCSTTERVVDLCAGYATDPKCNLADESVDGVETFRKGVATGLKPLALTRLVGTGRCTTQLTRDFFERSRSYLCKADSTALPEPDLGRGAYIIDRSSETILADRVKAADGSTTTSTRSFALPDRGTVAACEPICKTRAPSANAGAALDGVVGAKQNDPAGWDTFYHACGAGLTCPAGPGEEIVSACGCLDDFPEAAIMMQTVRLGGADLVCTATAR